MRTTSTTPHLHPQHTSLATAIPTAQRPPATARSATMAITVRACSQLAPRAPHVHTGRLMVTKAQTMTKWTTATPSRLHRLRRQHPHLCLLTAGLRLHYPLPIHRHSPPHYLPPHPLSFLLHSPPPYRRRSPHLCRHHSPLRRQRPSRCPYLRPSPPHCPRPCQLRYRHRSQPPHPR